MKTAFLFYLILLVTTSLNANSKISLKLDCETSAECSARKWYLTDKFEESFIEAEDFQPDETWKLTQEFPIWLNQHFPKTESHSEYSMFSTFNLTESFLDSDKHTGIRFGEIGEAFNIYINGKKIYSEGRVKDGKVILHRTVRGMVYEIPKKYLKVGENKLLIHIQGDPRFDHTGFYLKFGYDIGYYDDLKSEQQNRLELALILVYVVIGYYHLLLYLKRRKERENFYFAIYCLGLAIYLITRTSSIFEFNVDSALIQRIELAVLYPMSSMLFIFHDALFNRKTAIVNRIYFFINLLLCIPTIFVPLYMAEYILRFWQLLAFLVGLPIGLSIFIKAIKQNRVNAKRLFIFFLAFNIAPAIFDILDSAIFNTGIALTKYAFFFYILGLFTVLANKFVSLHNQTEELNANLEKKVEQRTEELSHSLSTVQELKRQQDGDYFLTSLLIRSLVANQSTNDKVQIEFRMKQKKQFEFQKHKSEIGGDLCRAEDLLLNGKPFTVFFNADAMGKSMQGAGGALVLGAVFDAILERTVLNKNINAVYPERWLKNTILELHKVFESFDGSMLVSIVIGIIDKETGLMHFFNAEHPAPVLFRDGEVSFLGEEHIGRKLGSPLTGSFLLIQSFVIQPSDIIVLGSDGRDDIFLENHELNSDENLFLNLVKENQGNLDSIFHYFQSRPEILSDDLSLMSLQLEQGYIPKKYSFKEEMSILPPTAIEIEKEWEAQEKLESKNPYLLKQMALHFMAQSRFPLAYKIAKEYIEILPEDTEMIFQTGVLAKKVGNYTDAIEQGERVRIRNPFHLDNLANLAKSYLLLGVMDRVQVILGIFEDFAPTHDIVTEIRARIKQSNG